MSGASATQAKINDAFSKLSYEPVLDSDSSVRSWIGTHNNGLFTPFINGSYLDATKNEQLKGSFVTKNPFNGSDLAKISECGQPIVDLAVKSARDALQSWSKLGYIKRGKIIYK